ncbi:hypothetical protein HDU67_002598 [Dinochytrium kinnereticum]|nr:hypothetical protein HDU67_002598 [Dinochytrium kinnereticum]
MDGLARVFWEGIEEDDRSDEYLMPFRRLAMNSRAAEEVSRKEMELGVTFPASLKALFSIENISRILYSLHGQSPTSPMGSGLYLSNLRKLCLLPVPKEWAHLGTALIKFLVGGLGASYILFNPSSPHPNPLVFAAPDEFYPANLQVEQDYILPQSLAGKLHDIPPIPENLAIAWPSRLVDFVKWLVRDSFGTFEEAGRSLRRSVVCTG